MYHNKARGLTTLVHGDDYVTVGSEDSAMWLKGELEKVFDIKTSVVGRRSGLKKEVRVLNRVIRWTHEGWEYEADQRHAEIIVKESPTWPRRLNPGGLGCSHLKSLRHLSLHPSEDGS